MNFIILIAIGIFGSIEAANQSQVYHQLNNGKTMQILGFSTWLTNGTDAYQLTKTAIEKGYKFIDTAWVYGNEKEVGKAINHLIYDGKVKRDDIFVETRVWNTFHNRESAVKNINMSLANLGMKYIDLVLIHWPFGYKDGVDPYPYDKNHNIIFSHVDYLETWSGLEDAQQMGLVKSIGISSFNSKQIQRIIKNAKIPPAINRIECNPLLNQQKLIDFCYNYDVAVTAFSPFASGNLFTNVKIKAIADRHKKSPAQVLIRYQIQRNVSVLIKTTNSNRMEEDLNVFDFNLTPDHIKQIHSLNNNTRKFDMTEAKQHKYYPFNDPF